MNKFLSIMLICATIFTSCGGDEGEKQFAPPELVFTYDISFDLPTMTIGTTITNINVTTGVSGGISPYNFSAEGLPAGITISTAGVITGTPTETKAAGSATVTVEDSSSPKQHKSITIKFGEVSEEEEEARIVLPNPEDKEQMAFADDETTGGFTFTAKSAWTAYVEEISLKVRSVTYAATRANGVQWLRLLLNGEETYSGDAGTFTLTIELDENYTGADRSATITITSGSTDITISVTQKGTTEQGATPIAVTSVTITPSEDLTAEPGESVQLTATVLPDDAGNKAVTWSVSPVGAATVNATGKVTIDTNTAAGTTITVTATSVADTDIKDTKEITVEEPRIPVTGITLDQTFIEMTLTGSAGGSPMGYAAQLLATTYPANATNKNITWKSSNPAVVTVADAYFNNGYFELYYGEVYYVGDGTAVITVTTEDGGHTATCTVTVNAVHATGVQIVEQVGYAAFQSYPAYTKAVPLGSTFMMGAYVTPENAYNQNITWSSSNPATIDMEYVYTLNYKDSRAITVNATGTFTVTVTTQAGGFTDSRAVTVFIEDVADLEGNYTWAEAKAACSAKGSGWRLPSLDELKGMEQHADGKGYYFNYKNAYWSSTETDANTAEVWSFYVPSPIIVQELWSPQSKTRSSGMLARCVR